MVFGQLKMLLESISSIEFIGSIFGCVVYNCWHQFDIDLIQVAPYNTFYSHLEEHMSEVGIVPTINKWNESLALGAVDPHDSLSHPTGASDKQSESASCVDPDLFTNFLVRFPLSVCDIGY